MTTRMRVAIAALPFESPKLAVTAVVSEQDFATVLDRGLKRIEEMKAKVIEAKPAISGEKVDARLDRAVRAWAACSAFNEGSDSDDSYRLRKRPGPG